MKSFAKWLIAGGIVLGLGLMIFIIGIAANGWKWGIETDFEQREYTAGQPVTDFDIHVAAGNVSVVFAETDRVSVSYPANGQFGYEVKENNGKLTLRYTSSWRNFFGWFMPAHIPDTVITVPYGTANFDLTVDAGKLILSDGAYGNVNINVNAGKFEAGSIACTNLTCDTDAGKADISAVQCSLLTVDLDAGGVTVGAADCTKLIVDVDAGNATLNGVSCSDISVDVDAGSANITVNGAMSDYDIGVEVNAGSCNLSTQTVAESTGRITVQVDAGSANFNFTK